MGDSMILSRSVDRVVLRTVTMVAAVIGLFFMVLAVMAPDGGLALRGLAPIAIGLGLTLIHLIGIPVTNLSVNPARSTGPAVFVGGWAIAQLWLFWVAPIVGAALAGRVYPIVAGEPDES